MYNASTGGQTTGDENTNQAVPNAATTSDSGSQMSTGSPTGTPNYGAVKNPVDRTVPYFIADDMGRQADYDNKFSQMKKENIDPAITTLTTTRNSAIDANDNFQTAQQSGNPTTVQQAQQNLNKSKSDYQTAQANFVDSDKRFDDKLNSLNTESNTTEEMSHANEMKQAGMNQPSGRQYGATASQPQTTV